MNKFIGVGWYSSEELSDISFTWEVLVLFAGMIAIITLVLCLCDGCSKGTLLISIVIITLGFIEWTFAGLRITMALCIFAHACRAIYWIADNYIYFNRYVKMLSDYVVSLDFNTIKNLYSLNPKRFSRLSYRECAYTPAGHISIDVCIPSKVEYLKYTFWRYEIEKAEQRAKEIRSKSEKAKYNAKATKMILNQAQLDIEALRKKSEAELNEAMSTLKEVQSNMIGKELR